MRSEPAGGPDGGPSGAADRPAPPGRPDATGRASGRGPSAPPELVLDARATLGEGPLWDVRRGVVWWLDIPACAVHAFDPAAGTDRAWPVGSEVGAAALDDAGRLLLGLPERLAAFDPADSSLQVVADLPPGPTRLRCNDCRPDPAGRLWLGRMAFDEAEGAGALLRIERDGAIVVAIDGLTCPNGMAWAQDGLAFVFIDSPRRTLERFIVDPASGIPGPATVLLDLATTDLPPGAVPDGMAVDAEEHLWVAIWGGGCLLRVAPNGRITDRLAMPVSQPTSCAFAGPGLEGLYVTSAREGLDPDALAREPLAGGLFRVRPGVAGRPANAYRPLARGR